MTDEARLRAALALNVVIVGGQAVFGIATGSLGLLADAGHNLTDVGAIVLSLVALQWTRRSPTKRRSFGYHRAAVLAAQANAMAIVAVTAVIAYEAVRRLLHPISIHGWTIVVVASTAFAANLVASLVLGGGHSHDLNMRAALLHMAGDALASLGVVVAGTVMAITGRFAWLDPAVAILIAVLIAVQGVRLVHQAVGVLLESTPPGVDLDDVAAEMVAVAGVEDVHDLHVWGLTEDMRILSAHLILEGHPTLEEAQAVGTSVKRRLSARFAIVHATLELECEGCVDDGSWCAIGDIAATHHHA